MLRRDGVDVAATYALGAMHSEKGIPAHWLIDFASGDVDETVAKIRAAQGGLLFGSFDVGPQGRSAIWADRHGAMFGVWQAGTHIGSGLVEEPSTVKYGPLPIPNIGQFAVSLDPQSVVFTVIELSAMPSLSEMERSA